MYVYFGIIFWGVIIFFLLLARKKHYLHNMTVIDCGRKGRLIAAAFCALTIITCLLPMGISPTYNGEKYSQRMQYEELAESIINGHIYLDYEVDPKLLEMENPYDPEARDKEVPDARYDTAYYDGHYYMYFGVTPVFLVYLPYRIITGQPLLGYHGTQFIVAMFIIGVFILFKELCRLFFKNMSLGVYIALSIATSVIGAWYACAAPALYMVPIISGATLMVYSYYFFIKAVWSDCNENKSILYAFIGSLFGALAFGCRPPVAIANLFVLPMLVTYLKKYKPTPIRILKLVVAALPYFIIGALIMVYNYVRFENPFEFGQSYQFTAFDQTNYMGMLERWSWHDEFHGLIDYFVISSWDEITPLALGVFVSFPIMLMIIFAAFNRRTLKEVISEKMMFFMIVACATPIIIVLMDILWSPFFWARYRADVYWLMGILMFFAVGFIYRVYEKKTIPWIAVLSMVSIIMCFFMFAQPFDHNYAWDYDYTTAEIMKHVVTFGIM